MPGCPCECAAECGDETFPSEILPDSLFRNPCFRSTTQAQQTQSASVTEVDRQPDDAAATVPRPRRRTSSLSWLAPNRPTPASSSSRLSTNTKMFGSTAPLKARARPRKKILNLRWLMPFGLSRLAELNLTSKRFAKRKPFRPALFPADEKLLVRFLTAVQKDDMLPAIVAMNELLSRFPNDSHALSLTAEWLYFSRTTIAP